ncbi:MAG: inositol monophosphatase family protein [Candidatus Omnitrophota bacterium]
MEDNGKMMECAVEAAKKAGEYVVSRMGKLKEIGHKGGISDLVTDADKESERIITGMIRERFPSHSLLAEEGGESKGENKTKWIIDPIDGTTNFAHGFPVFCVSIGVSVGGEVKLGVVYDPTRKELFAAEKGKGATLNGVPMRVSKEEKVQGALVATGFAYDVEKKEANIENFKIMLRNAQAVRRPGSAAIDLCYVACGRFDGFWESYLSPWDTAAGHLMVTEAGGIVTKFDGQLFDIFEPEIVATNGKIHEEMLKLLSLAEKPPLER